MWADRLGALATASGASTPQPGSRPYSPAPPRRTPSNLSPYITSQRPGHSPRASTLSLVSNDSNSSLLASSRRANGSGLKQSTSASDDTEALEALARLLGDDGRGPKSPAIAAPNSITEADLALDHEFGGLSLRDLAHEDDQSQAPGAAGPQTAEECTMAMTPFTSLFTHNCGA